MPRASPPLTPLAWSVRPSFVVRAGLLPDAAPGVALAVSLHRDWWRVEAEVGTFGQQREALGPGEALFSAWVTAVRGCTVRRVGRGQLRSCVGVEVGVVAGRGFGVSDPAAGSSPWVAPTAGGAASWRVARGLTVMASLEAAALVDAPRFFFEGIGDFSAPWPVTVRAGLGAELTP